MTDAVLGAGSSLQLGDGADPEVFTAISEVLRCGQIGSSAPEVDATNLDSTAKEYLAGLPDGESFEFNLNWLAGNTQQEALRDAVGSTVNLRMVWSDTSQADFSYVVLGFGRDETTPEDKLTATLRGRITGAITWA